MKSAKICLIFLSLIFTISINAQSTLPGYVSDVIDGKTLVVTTMLNKKVTIQLRFIEVPEANQPLNDVVKQHLHKLAFNQKVNYSIAGLTKNSIAIGKVSVNGIDLSQQMIRDGAAWYNLPENDVYTETERHLYKDVETVAKTEQRGVWGIEGLKPSWEYRAEQKAKILEQERLEREAKIAEDRKRDNVNAKNSIRPTEEYRRQANEKVQMWANISKNGDSKDAGNSKDIINSEYIRSRYDNDRDSTVNETKFIKLYSPNLKGNDSLSVGFAHIFSGINAETAANHFYVFGVDLVSDKINLSAQKNLKLILTSGKNRYVLNIFVSQTSTFTAAKSSKIQSFIFRISKTDFDKLIKSTKINYEVGNLRGTVPNEFVEVLKQVP